jgi:hypothetical protein
MKGQLVFEFIVAVVLFFTIIIFVLNILNADVSMYTEGYIIYSLEDKAVDTSELLLKTKGAWSGATPLSVGLASEWPVLDGTKVSNLDDYCDNNYIDFISKLDLLDKPLFGDYNVKFIIETPSDYYECVPPLGKGPGNLTSANIKRYAVLDGEIATVNVWVW